MDSGQKCTSLLQEYIRTDPTDREKDSTVIFAVKQGMEPEAFKLLFPSWSDVFWQVCSLRSCIYEKCTTFFSLLLRWL